MEHRPDLEVDVNGEEVFRVDKDILASFSGRLSNLFANMKGKSTALKVIFHDFPGGARGFELIARYCYSHGKIQTNPHQNVLLKRAANYMQMKKSGKASLTLIQQTQKSLEGIGVWPWSELLLALKLCQVLPSDTDLQCIIQKLLESLAERIISSRSSTPSSSSSSSSERPSVQSTRSLEFSGDSFCQITWWFADIVCLNTELIRKLVEIMKLKNFCHGTIWKFLLFYQRSRFQGAEQAERCEVAESVINLLSTLDKGAIAGSCKILFDVLRMSKNLKVNKQCKNKLESLIGSCLDQATLDDLLIPSSIETKDYIYDVNLVQRLLKHFLLQGNNFTSSKLKAVSRLMDSYAMEIAPVASLKPPKFAAILMALPDSARDCHDGIYQAIDLYLQVHSGLKEEEKMAICSELNLKKLSRAALKHLSQNPKFPSRVSTRALVCRQSRFGYFHRKTPCLDCHIVKKTR